MPTAKDIMVKNVVTIKDSATVAEAVATLKKMNLRDLIVEPKSKEDAFGIITETDVVYKVLAQGKNPKEVKVSEIMTKPLIVINPDLDVKFVAQLFAHSHIRRAPVIKGGLLGVITVTDLIKTM